MAESPYGGPERRHDELAGIRHEMQKIVLQHNAIAVSNAELREGIDRLTGTADHLARTVEDLVKGIVGIDDTSRHTADTLVALSDEERATWRWRMLKDVASQGAGELFTTFRGRMAIVVAILTFLVLVSNAVVGIAAAVSGHPGR